MAFDDRSYAYRSQTEAANAVDAGLRAYMLRVYNFMASGVALTGIVSWLVTYTSLSQVFFTQDPIGRLQPAPLAWVAMIASVGIVFGLSAMVSRMQTSTATALFWAYAGIKLAEHFGGSDEWKIGTAAVLGLLAVGEKYVLSKD